MASVIHSGESIFIPFRDGHSILDSQLKPRMYKTPEAFQKSFPGHYLGTKDIELSEYAPVVHGRWEKTYVMGGIERKYSRFMVKCSVCGWGNVCQYNFCPNCGAKMDGDEEA